MDLKREQYQEWRHHPVSKVFFQYLRDKQALFKTTAADAWVDGKPFDEVVRGQIIEMIEIAELPFEAIEEFYKERDNAAEVDSNSEGRVSPSVILGEE